MQNLLDHDLLTLRKSEINRIATEGFLLGCFAFPIPNKGIGCIGRLAAGLLPLSFAFLRKVSYNTNIGFSMKAPPRQISPE